MEEVEERAEVGEGAVLEVDVARRGEGEVASRYALRRYGRC